MAAAPFVLPRFPVQSLLQKGVDYTVPGDDCRTPEELGFHEYMGLPRVQQIVLLQTFSEPSVWQAGCGAKQVKTTSTCGCSISWPADGQSPSSAFFNPVLMENPDGTPDAPAYSNASMNSGEYSADLGQSGFQSPMSAFYNPYSSQLPLEWASQSGCTPSVQWSPIATKEFESEMLQSQANDIFSPAGAGSFTSSVAQLSHGHLHTPDSQSEAAFSDGEDEQVVPLLQEQVDTEDALASRICNWQLPIRYQLGKFLGAGAYGSVISAWDHKQQRKCAVKRTPYVLQNDIHGKRILREVAILSKLHHSNIVQIYDVLWPSSQDGVDLYIVTERCDSDLRKVCRHPRGLSMPQARKLAHGLLCGCRYLHSVGVYHRDLKPANCLVNQDCSMKICDFNLARIVDCQDLDPEEEDAHGQDRRAHGQDRSSRCRSGRASRGHQRMRRALTRHVASRWYRSPEVILQLGYSEAMDIWSAGCIIGELFMVLNDGGRQPTWRALFPGGDCYPLSQGSHGRQQDEPHQLDVIFEVLGTPNDAELRSATLHQSAREHISVYARRSGVGLHTLLPPEAGEAGLDLLKRMLRLLPDDRVSAKRALQHPFFERVCRSPGEDEFDVAPQPLDIGYDESAFGDTVSMVRDQLSFHVNKFRSLN